MDSSPTVSLVQTTLPFEWDMRSSGFCVSLWCLFVDRLVVTKSWMRKEDPMKTSTAVLVFRWCLSIGVMVFGSSLVFAATANVDGTLKSVAASGKTITVTVGNGGSAKTESFSVTMGTMITVDDKPAKLSELKPGSKVSISYDKRSKDAASIKALSAMADHPKPELPAAPVKTAANTKDAPPPTWTMDLAKMQIPDAPASGKIHGQPFKLEKVQLQGSVLELRQGKDFFPDLSLKIFLKVKEDESLEGKSIRVTSKDGFGSPQIHMQFRARPGEGVPVAEIFFDQYEMLLQFGKAQDGALPGKIFVSLPDKSQSFVAGTFALGGADAGEGATTSLISGKIDYHGKERKFDAFVGCLGKNKGGKLESPGAGFPVSLDEPSGSVTCTTWKPRNTSLTWDKKTGLSHKSTNRPAGAYLVFVKNEESLFDWKWVELKDDSAKITADLAIDPAQLGSLEVNVIGEAPKNSSVYCLPLNDQGEIPVRDELGNFAPLSSKIEAGKATIRQIRAGKYQLGLFRTTVTAEVKAGATTKVDLVVPPPNATTPTAPATSRLTPASAWIPLNVVELSSSGGATLKEQKGGVILASGLNPAKDTYVIVAEIDLKKITGLRLDVFKHDSLPNGGPGRLPNGTFILSRVEIKAAPKGSNEAAKPVAVAKATADYTQQGHSVANLIDGKPGPGWAIWNNGTANHHVDFQFDKPLTFEAGAKLTITLKHESQWADGNLGCFRWSATTDQVAVAPQKVGVNDVPDFSQVIGMKKLSPVKGRRAVLAILWDPHRAGHAAPPAKLLDELLFGRRPSVADWIAENSGGAVTLEKAGLLGWYDATKPGDHYWNTNAKMDAKDADGDGWLNGHVEKWTEAIRQADREFDFARYDSNGDKVLQADELAILILIPQAGPFGTNRVPAGREFPKWEPLIVDGMQIPMIAEVYSGLPPNLGAPAHELSHLLLGAPDLYMNAPWPFAAGDYCLMDHSYTSAHLSPFLKLKLGWLKPNVVTKSGDYRLKAVEEHGECLVLFDPSHGSGEYFLLENRHRGRSYDAGVGQAGRGLPSDGLAVWHILEDPQLIEFAKPPLGGPGEWGRKGIRLIRANGGNPFDDSRALFTTRGTTLSDTSEPARLRWIDGSTTGFRIALNSDPGPELQLQISLSHSP